MTTRPTQAMWWVEMAIGLAVAAATFTAIGLGSSAAQGHHVTLDGGASTLLIALSTSVGIFVSGRYPAHNLENRRGSDVTVGSNPTLTAGERHLTRYRTPRQCPVSAKLVVRVLLTCVDWIG
ncbi:hypothetical protein ABZV24_30545 [Streptomyces sp. NPDC005251]|uniref:hypothetical protein n=1 Tax=Streptomyces sp. NPDC005251 TaxID=3157166 RepID=UPI00339F099E